MRVLVIPDIHLKPWMFERAAEIMEDEGIEQAVCLMDIPDDWRQEYNIGMYEDTFDRAYWFQLLHPNTLWCYGNHDLSYLWQQPESGFSPMAILTVRDKLMQLERALPEREQLAYIHRIDRVLFLHGGLTKAFVKYYASDIDYDDVDAVVERINSLGIREMWDDASPIWFRPQVNPEVMYKRGELVQVVGHTPVHDITEEFGIVSCDNFSTYRDGSPIGTEKFLIIDTESLRYEKK